MATAEKLERTLQNQTTTARKVYDFVPAKTSLPLKTIIADMRRNQCAIDYSIVEGCLNHLRGEGLVREPMPGHFIRTEGGATRPSPDPVAMMQQDRGHNRATHRDPPARNVLDFNPVEPDPAEPEVVATPDPMVELGRIAGSLRGLASTIEAMAKEIDAAAMACQEKLEQSGDADQKLSQLRSLLGGLVK